MVASTHNQTEKTKSKKKKTPSPNTSTTASLAAAQRSALEEFGRAKETRKSYNGYLERGRKFLSQLVADRRANNVQDDLDTNLLAMAFSGPPNKTTVTALEHYITEKCFKQGKGNSTAVGIQGAFADYYDRMSGGQYGGDYYEYNSATDEIRGNPARATSFRDLVKATHNRGRGDDRNHAEAITIEAMRQILEWSESQYPSEALKRAPKDREELKLALKHAKGRAMFVFGFVLWTRSFELAGVRIGHIARRQNEKGQNYLEVHVTPRKACSDSEDDGLRNRYNIYPETDPALDLYSHLNRLLDYMTLFAFKRPLKPDDYLFPHLPSSGTYRSDAKMSYDAVQKVINEFSRGAGITVTYTTHCFRRGGAKYRFMLSKPWLRWPLHVVRWWGGWVEGESVDTLSKYLLDSLQKMEKSYGDFLNPSNQNMKPAVDIPCPNPYYNQQSHQYSYYSCPPSHLAPFTPTGVFPFSNSPSPSPSRQGTLDNAPNSTFPAIAAHSTVNHFNAHDMAQMENPVTLGGTNTMTEKPSGVSVSEHLYNENSEPRFYSRVNIAPNFPADAPAIVAAKNRKDYAPVPHTTNLLPDSPKHVILPTIAKLGRARGEWRKALKQWESVDLHNGRALKDWPKSWYKLSASIEMTYMSRKIIWEEYERLGGTEMEFLAKHPEADQVSYKTLEKKIKMQNGIMQRRSKNGTPRERRYRHEG